MHSYESNHESIHETVTNISNLQKLLNSNSYLDKVLDGSAYSNRLPSDYLLVDNITVWSFRSCLLRLHHILYHDRPSETNCFPLSRSSPVIHKHI